jgi:hypothetical protein
MRSNAYPTENFESGYKKIKSLKSENFESMSEIKPKGLTLTYSYEFEPFHHNKQNINQRPYYPQATAI